MTGTCYAIYAKRMLEKCPHYDEIINYNFEYDKDIAFDIIDWYKELIFSSDEKDEKRIKLVHKIDSCLYKYILDYRYRKGLNEILREDSINLECYIHNNKIIRKIINYTDRYEEEEILNIRRSKWL